MFFTSSAEKQIESKKQDVNPARGRVKGKNGSAQK